LAKVIRAAGIEGTFQRQQGLESTGKIDQPTIILCINLL
jgi:hypothetical protein